MSSSIGADLRRIVTARANYLCEYCLVHEDDAFFGCEVDHVVSVKHGGPTEEVNLAYACFFCNRYKGSDIGSIWWRTGEFVRFFNPRKDRWADLFRLKNAIIEPLTAIGEVTARILRFNEGDRILERQTLIAMDRYPTALALKLMGY